MTHLNIYRSNGQITVNIFEEGYYNSENCSVIFEIARASKKGQIAIAVVKSRWIIERHIGTYKL